jgi:lipopolysaccharide exporter
VRPSLTNRVKSGLAWSAGAALLTHGVGLARSVILARLLAPDDYGLFGIALTVLVAITTLTHTGLDLSILARRFTDDAELRTYLDTVWTVELARRFLLALALITVAYPAAWFYGDARLNTILALLSLTPLIQGFQNIGLLLLRKEISLRKLIFFEQLTNLLATLATIGMAFWTHGARALMLGHLAGAALGAALSYLFHPYRPRLAFDREAFRTAFKFGKYMFVMAVMGYILTTADNILIGKLLGTYALGAYLVAYSLANLPVGVIISAIGGVTLPAYTELGGHGKERLDNAFVKAFTIGSALLAIIYVPLMLLADELILLLYGSKWAAAISVLRILTLLGFLRGHLYIFSPYLLSVRGAAPDARAKVFETLIFLSLLYPLTKSFGIEGAAWAGVAAYALGLVNRFLSFSRMVAASTSKRILLTFSAIIIIGAFGVLSGTFVLSVVQGALARLLIVCGVSAAVMLATLCLMLPVFRREVFEFTSVLKAWLRLRKSDLAAG